MKIPLGKLPLQNYKWTVPQSKLLNVSTFRVTQLCKETSSHQNTALLTSPPPDTTGCTSPGIAPTEFRSLEIKVCSNDETRNNSKGLNTTGKTRKKSGTRGHTKPRIWRRKPTQNHNPGREEEGTRAQPLRKGANQSKTTVLVPKTLEKML